MGIVSKARKLQQLFVYNWLTPQGGYTVDILARRVAKRHTSISSSKKFPIHSLLSLGIIGLLTLVFFFSSFIGMRQEAHALSNGVALTPPMGWSSWNAHFANINASVIRTAA